jgi:hypothetical protein
MPPVTMSRVDSATYLVRWIGQIWPFDFETQFGEPQRQHRRMCRPFFPITYAKGSDPGPWRLEAIRIYLLDDEAVRVIRILHGKRHVREILETELPTAN